MEYRRIGRTGDKVGIIGVGTSSNGATGPEETTKMINLVLDSGVNYFDLAMAGDKLAADH